MLEPAPQVDLHRRASRERLARMVVALLDHWQLGTNDQAALLGRYTKQVVLLYDSDDAGLRATFRAGDELLRHGLRVFVATLPEGEDPDTLVQARGAGALQTVLGDAVDLLERKIQILERRGFFGTVPGRRRALDRLLPTLRAASDPITRELYLSRVSEAAGIRKDVLEREVGAGSGERTMERERAAGSGRSRGRPSGGSPGNQFDRSPLPAPLLPAGAEKALLLLMLAGDAWPARVKDAVDPEEFDFPVYRSLYEALLDDAPDRLDETAARAFEQLKAEGLSGRDPDRTFTAAVNWIEARRLEREVERLEGEIPLASDDDKVRLLKEKQRLATEMNARYPRYKMLRRIGAPGS